MMDIIIEIVSPKSAEELCREITKGLLEYFGLSESNENYAIGVRANINFAAKIAGSYIGLLSLELPYPNNGNIYWMGVRSEFRNQGIGKQLLEAACIYAKEAGASTISVETLSLKEADKNYYKTYNFYQGCGFRPLFNLKPSGYEWNMVYMIKDLARLKPCLNTSNFSIKNLTKEDIPLMVQSFAEHNWSKPHELFEGYLSEISLNERRVWLAYLKGRFAGYITLKLKSSYAFFYEREIPEINDFNVLPPFRKLGIGSRLLKIAEEEAVKVSNTVGLGVGLHESYGAALKLYVKNGYIPNGQSITYREKEVEFGESIPLDDDLVLWFTKNLG